LDFEVLVTRFAVFAFVFAVLVFVVVVFLFAGADFLVVFAVVFTVRFAGAFLRPAPVLALVAIKKISWEKIVFPSAK
jgi:hypothetical protein